MLIIYYVFNTICSELGIVDENDDKFKLISTDSLSSISLESGMKETKSSNPDLSKKSNTGSQNNLNKLGEISRCHPKIFEEIHPTLINNSIKLKDSNVNESKINTENEEEIKEKSKIIPEYLLINSNEQSGSSNSLSPSNKQKSGSNEKINEKKSHKKKKNKALIRSIKSAHILFVEALIFYPLLLLFLISSIIIYKLKESNYNKLISNTEEKDVEIEIDRYLEQNQNDEWAYKCELMEQDIFYHLIELVLLFVVLLRGKKIMKFTCIFKCTKYITYSSIIAFALGPIINVIFNISIYYNNNKPFLLFI